MAKLKTGQRKRPGGGYEMRFIYEGVRYSVYSDNTTDLEEKAEEKKAQLKAGIYHTNETITLSQYFDEWIKVKAMTVKPATVFAYTTIYNKHIRKALGRQRVRKIERRQVVALIDRVANASGIGAATEVRKVLGGLFHGAMIDDIVPRNVVSTVPFLKRKTPPARETIHRELSDNEIKILFSITRNTSYALAFRFMLFTGVRVGECAALTWKDIDWKRKMVHIRRTMTKDSKGNDIVGDTTKTDKSVRDIPMNEDVKSILDSQMNLYRDLNGFIDLSAPVFPKARGGFSSENAIGQTLRSCIKRYNKTAKVRLKPFSIHALRDTFASRAIRAGVAPNTLKEILGHSSLSMTMDLYAHVSQEDKKKAMEKVRAINF